MNTEEAHMDRSFKLVAILRARAGFEDELGRRLASLIAPTRREPGCTEYVLHRSQTDAAVWVLYEGWRSKADLERHFSMPYLREFLADAPGMLSEDMTLHYLDQLGDTAGATHA